jgi:hypothetical protein
MYCKHCKITLNCPRILNGECPAVKRDYPECICFYCYVKTTPSVNDYEFFYGNGCWKDIPKDIITNYIVASSL